MKGLFILIIFVTSVGLGAIGWINLSSDNDELREAEEGLKQNQAARAKIETLALTEPGMSSFERRDAAWREGKLREIADQSLVNAEAAVERRRAQVRRDYFILGGGVVLAVVALALLAMPRLRPPPRKGVPSDVRVGPTDDMGREYPRD